MERSSHYQQQQQQNNMQSSQSSSGGGGVRLGQQSPHQQLMKMEPVPKQSSSRQEEDEQSSSSSSDSAGLRHAVGHHEKAGGPSAGGFLLMQKQQQQSHHQQHLGAENGGEASMSRTFEEMKSVKKQGAREAAQMMGDLTVNGGEENDSDSNPFMRAARDYSPPLQESTMKQLEILHNVLDQYSQTEVNELFTLYSDTKSSGAASTAPLPHGISPQGKIVLTEQQFNLVKKVYPKCFSQTTGRLNLCDNQLILQFFMNLKHLYMLIQRSYQGGKINDVMSQTFRESFLGSNTSMVFSTR